MCWLSLIPKKNNISCQLHYMYVKNNASAATAGGRMRKNKCVFIATFNTSNT